MLKRHDTTQRLRRIDILGFKTVGKYISGTFQAVNIRSEEHDYKHKTGATLVIVQDARLRGRAQGLSGKTGTGTETKIFFQAW